MGLCAVLPSLCLTHSRLWALFSPQEDGNSVPLLWRWKREFQGPGGNPVGHGEVLEGICGERGVEGQRWPTRGNFRPLREGVLLHNCCIFG